MKRFLKWWNKPRSYHSPAFELARLTAERNAERLELMDQLKDISNEADDNDCSLVSRLASTIRQLETYR